MPKFTSMEGGFAGPTSLVTQYPFNYCIGGTETIVGKYKLHTFTQSGIFTVSKFGGIMPLIEIFVVGGGGGGAPAYGAFPTRSGYASNTEYMAGGGGSGGAIYHPGFVFPASGNYSAVVGAGATNTPGSNQSYGAMGNDSTFTVGSTVFRAYGGGAGGFWGSNQYNGISGGSGGGTGTTGGIILNKPSPASNYARKALSVTGATTYGSQGGGTQNGGGGGGGGLGGDGLPGEYFSNNSPHGSGGGGGPGISNPCEGSTYTPIGGGGGGGGAYDTGTELTAGSEYLSRLDAAANYGGGGGGGSIFGNDGGWGGAGGSGIIILRYRIAV